MNVGCAVVEVKPAGGDIVVRTASLTVITAVTVVLAAAAAGCSSHRSQAAAVQSAPQSAPASTQLTGAPSPSTGPPSSAAVNPTNPFSESPRVTSAPPVTSPSVLPRPSVPTPTSGPAVPPLGTRAITAVAGLPCPNPASPGQATSPSPKPLPPSLVITAVVRCETVQRSYPVGSWSVQLAEVADSGLGPFLAALRAPSDPMPSGIMCPDFRILVPWFELVDSAGIAINVAIPTDQCGAPKTAAITALQALPFRVTDAVRISAVH